MSLVKHFFFLLICLPFLASAYEIPARVESHPAEISQKILKSLAKIQEKLKKEQHEQVLEELDYVKTLSPTLNLGSLYLTLADVFDRLGDWKQSITSYQRYLQQILKTTVIPIEEYWNIGWAYYMTGYPEKALTAGLNFAKIYPNNTYHNLNLALYYLTLGYEAEAINLYMWSFSVTLNSLSLYTEALNDLKKSKDLFFYAYAKQRLENGYHQLKTLHTLQENL